MKTYIPKSKIDEVLKRVPALYKNVQRGSTKLVGWNGDVPLFETKTFKSMKYMISVDTGGTHVDVPENISQRIIDVLQEIE